MSEVATRCNGVVKASWQFTGLVLASGGEDPEADGLIE